MEHYLEDCFIGGFVCVCTALVVESGYQGENSLAEV